MYPTKKFSCIIIDDDDDSIEGLKQYIDSYPYLELIRTYNNPITAVKEISLSKTPIDFLFLDIQMSKLSGLEVASVIRHKVDKLIFTTAHAKHSLAAYEVLCNQYILKPFSQQKFEKTIHRLIDHPKQEFPRSNENIFIKVGNNGKYLQLKCDDIIYINAMEHYVVIHTPLEQYIQHTSMKDVEYALRNNDNFIRVHKSHIISKKHILSVYGNKIILSNNVEIIIGATFKQSFTNFLSSNSLN